MVNSTRQTAGQKGGHTKVVRQVTKSRSGKVIEETETVEKHSYDNGKKTITTTTTTTKRAQSSSKGKETDGDNSRVTSKEIEELGPKDSDDTHTTTITTVETHEVTEEEEEEEEEEEQEEEEEEEEEEDDDDEDSWEDDEITLEVKDEFLGNEPSYFELSNCQGKKRALLVGINYIGSENALNGCISDVLKMKKFLMKSYGFRECDITVLRDDSEDPDLMPTYGNIRTAMGELCRDSQPNDSFFFHYSGHGGSIPDESGDEVDGMDECIFPCDCDEGYIIIDDLMHDLMVRPLCEGSRLTALFDSCHSGTVLDLPYIYSSKGHVKKKSLFRQASAGLFDITSKHKGGALKLLSSFMDLGQDLIKTREVESFHRELNTSAADVIMFSGCEDHEFSTDASVSNESVGAVSYAFMRTLTEKPDQTYQELLQNIRKMTVLKYDQNPQLSSSHPIDLKKKFIC